MTRANKVAIAAFVAVLALAPLGYDLSEVAIYDATTDVRVNFAVAESIRAVQYQTFGSAQALAEARTALEYGYLDVPKSAGTNPTMIWFFTSHRLSRLGWTADRFYQPGFVALVVELENGDRWAVATELPDVRKLQEITVAIPGPDARQITALKPKNNAGK